MVKISIDYRESKLIEQCNELIKKEKQFSELIIENKNLELGDIIISNDDGDKNFVIIERKTVSDLLSSIQDGRYSEQSFRLNSIEHENHNIIYLIEGSFRNLSHQKQMAYSSVFSINYFKGFSTLKSENVNETAFIILNMAYKLNKEKEKKPYYPKENNNEEEKSYTTVIKTKKNENITKDNFGEIVLMQIPNISSKTASVIMKEYKTINNLIDCLKKDISCIDNFTYINEKQQKRKLNKNVIENIKNFLH